jgi:hypothetical protein
MEKIKNLFRKVGILRDNIYWQKKVTSETKNLVEKIKKETNWLASSTSFGTERHALPYHEQVIKYHEYKNMLVQRRSQYVIIFLTITLLFMTGFQIYLEFVN